MAGRGGAARAGAGECGILCAHAALSSFALLPGTTLMSVRIVCLCLSLCLGQLVVVV